MKLKNIIIMTILPIGERDYKRFGIKYFEEQKKHILVLNVRSLIYENIPINYEINQYEKSFDYSEIENQKELNDILNKFSSSDTVIFLHCGYSEKVICEITKSNLKYGALFVNSIPNPIVNSSKGIQKIINRFNEIRRLYTRKAIALKIIKRILSYSLKKLKVSCKKIKKYDFVIVSGSESFSLLENTSKNTQIIEAHTMDMDFLIQDENLETIEDKYIVYLDEYLPYHSDFDLMGVDNKSIAKNYYLKMNKFLDSLAAKYKREVVICAHPRSDYTTKNVWKNKKIVYGETYNYVKRSFVCVTHASTSTNFAVLLNKPIQFIYFKDIDFYKNWIYEFAKSLDKKVINIDLITQQDIESINFVHIDKNIYQDYIYKYISKNEKDKRLLWEKVLNEL